MEPSFTTEIYPSLPAQDFEQLKNLAEAVKEHTTFFQVDLVDGVFAPAVSWPFGSDSDTSTVRESLSRLREITADFFVGADCMVQDPEQYFAVLAEANVRRVVIHYGSTDAMEEVIETARTHNFMVGLAVTNDVPPERWYPFLLQVDFLQVMGIAMVGKQGQPFDERTIDTVKAVREEFPSLVIAIDGSVNQETISGLAAAGANWFAPGSAVSRSPEPAKALADLRAVVAE